MLLIKATTFDICSYLLKCILLANYLGFVQTTKLYLADHGSLIGHT
ncbi:MAG: hypothetical protein GX238_09280 [Epulopiscium sp.]|nr:hypothetical protein [Candidatus Epulonipiscium sp.]